MGCGQSKILIYHRKSKADKADKQNTDAQDNSDGEAFAPSRVTDLANQDDARRELQPYGHIMDPDVNTNLLDNSEISTSQVDFFKMLDEKIESGPDYEEDEQERNEERERLFRMLNEWLRRPQFDTQRFPLAYQPCPPGRPPPRFAPKPLYPHPPRPYMFSRAVSVETADLHSPDRYMDHRRDEYSDHYGVPQEPAYGYSRSMLQSAAAYSPPVDSPEAYARNRAMLAKTAGRAMSFEAGTYGRHSTTENDAQGMSDYMQRGREMHYPPHNLQYIQHSALQYTQQPPHIPYGGGQDHIQYMARPPPRELAPLQGVPGPPGPHPLSPRPVAVRLPTSVSWRRPRGPVSELA